MRARKVFYLPNRQFNLFSTTTFQQKGWLLGLFTHTHKLGMVEPTCAQLAQLLQCNKDLRIIWLDNGRENIKLVQQAQGVEWRLPIKFEFTA